LERELIKKNLRIQKLKNLMIKWHRQASDTKGTWNLFKKLKLIWKSTKRLKATLKLFWKRRMIISMVIT